MADSSPEDDRNTQDQETAEPQQEKVFIDIHALKSRKKGLLGVLESLLRKYRTLSFAIALVPIIGTCLVCMGLAVTPALLFIRWIYEFTLDWNLVLHTFMIGLSLGIGIFIYGMSLIFILPAVNAILPLKVKPWRGNWYSLQSVPWYLHNALTYTARFTFLDFITPSPLNILFYKMMGMKIGKGVVINTTYISDPCLITLDDYVTIGGSATLFAHYGQKGILILSKVHIKKGATIGLKASVMGDVIVGEGAVVPPHEALLPKTRIPDRKRLK